MEYIAYLVFKVLMQESEQWLEDVYPKNENRLKKVFVSTYSFKHFDFLQLQRLQPSISPTGSDLRLHIQA